MNILIIGNGFDIAHGLPTKYKDFLKFIEQIQKIKNYHGTVNNFEAKIECSGYDKFNELDIGVSRYIDLLIRDDANPDMLVKDIYSNRPSKVINELIELTENNVWIKWFNKSEIKEGWIDFESEISNVVQQFEKITVSLQLNKKIPKSYDDFIYSFIDSKISIDSLTTSDFQAYKDIMVKDLTSLIRCLELYLEDCVRNIDKSLLSPDIYDLQVDKVLSFNYTDTYDRLYSCKNRNIEYDYIHGKTKIDKKTMNNMVLGIDEYLCGEERNSNIDYIEFKKYYQRIHKATGCVYKKWMEEIKESKGNAHNVYIFGHSLAVTDKDILKELITNDKIKTTVYYKDSKQYGQQIANLVKVLGQDELITMTYGSIPKIKFVMQKPMINKQDSEWQISNDIYCLCNLYQFSNDEITDKINRITENITKKNLSYFYNQRKIISLYDALLNNWKQDFENDLFDVAKSLYNPETYELFDANEWNDFDYNGERPCDVRVHKFINEINDFNSQLNDKKFTEFDVEHLDILYEQISKSKIDEKTFHELFDYVFSMFLNNEHDIKLLWKCIFSLGNKISPDRWSEFIKDRLSTSKEIDRVRFQHMQDVIDEQNYYECIQQQINEQENKFADICVE